ncbi:type VI secretion system amidase effector protein Tae4 [Paraburkholderia pallida]|uniref:Type VI secretion system (T6SS), amidase effector protein 4 n=1 Tax=Paraburkholderia pallida TaxID=2547399 RepID=A0A4V1B0G7_9BURK|nr:type VI secretion system amidase effector protein Tae4 [Paraburkholderia pallida]QBR02713.1 hypothetical protein E1956_36465 [Paraburkholderia pallida]
MPNQTTIVKTNPTRGSIKTVELNAVTFQQLWDNYPYGDPYDNSAYANQCAIRLSVTLHRVGIEMKSFSEKLIKPQSGQKQIGRILLEGKPTATRADEMGEWLKLQPFAGLPMAEDITGHDWESKVKSRTGIIQFSRYWARDGESRENASGGHIDLWNGSRMTISGFWDGLATVGRYMGFQSFRPRAAVLSLLSYSDLRDAKSILFWVIK